MDKTVKRAARAPKRSRRRESPAELRARARKIVARLERAYPDARCALNHTNALELLVATILSAQCTDARVNMVTPHLFAKYQSAAAYAAADPKEIERDLMQLLPRDKWTVFSHLLILHGRKVCIARRPKCEECVVSDLCPSSRV